MPVAESGPTGALRRRQAPVVGRQLQEQVLAEVRLDRQGGAERARPDLRHEVEDRRLEAPFMADAERQPRRGDRRDRTLRLGRRRAQRLLAEDVLAGRGGRDDLVGMELVRRREDHGIDVRLDQRVLEPRARVEAERLRCGTAALVGVDAENGTDHVAAREQAGDRAPPPAQTDERGADHASSSRNGVMAALKAVALSRFGRCAPPGISTNCAPGVAAAIARMLSAGAPRSSLPTT